MASRTPKEFKVGDMVRHQELDAVGVLISDKVYTNVCLWTIFWIQHPTDQNSLTVVAPRWLKEFRGYRKNKKEIDKGSE